MRIRIDAVGKRRRHRVAMRTDVCNLARGQPEADAERCDQRNDECNREQRRRHGGGRRESISLGAMLN